MRILTPTENKRFNELIGFVGLSLAVLLALSLLSYSPHDASFNVSAAPPGTGPARNWIGPVGAHMADLLFQFCDSDVVAVVRLDGSYHMRVIGRAVIANEEYESSSKFLAPMGLDTHPQTGLNFDKGVDLYIDIRTLQLMTQ